MVLNHSINKISLEFYFSKIDEHAALQESRDVFYQKLLPIIEEELDLISTHDERLYLSLLELDVTVNSLSDLSGFRAAFREKLQAQIHLPNWKKDHQEMISDILLDFFKTGYWPTGKRWQTESNRIEALEDWASELNHVENFFHTIARLQYPATYRLGVWCADTKTGQRLFQQWLYSRHPFLDSLTHDGAAFELGNLPSLLFTKGTGMQIAANTFAHTFWLALLMAEPVNNASELHSLCKKFSKQSPEKIVRKKKNSLWPEDFLSFKAEQQRIALFTFLRQQTDQDLIATSRFDARSYIDHNISEAAQWEIHNAGLILLHPFLPSLFTNLGWMTNTQEFVSVAKQMQSVLFLQFLINGKSQQQEHELALNKLLCNWPIHAPIQTKTRFSLAEKNAGRELLESLIGHWSVLKNTSPEGLVNAFLQRKGFLKKVENGFLLRVEKHAIDVLLEHLPYGISTLKHPYHDYLIFTEWD